MPAQSTRRHRRRASLVANPRRRHGHADRSIELPSLWCSPLRFLAGDCHSLTGPNSTYCGSCDREHRSPPASLVVMAVAAGGRLCHLLALGLGGGLGHDEVPATADRRWPVSYTGAAQERSHHGEWCHLLCPCCRLSHKLGSRSSVLTNTGWWIYACLG